MDSKSFRKQVVERMDCNGWKQNPGSKERGGRLFSAGVEDGLGGTGKALNELKNKSFFFKKKRKKKH